MITREIDRVVPDKPGWWWRRVFRGTLNVPLLVAKDRKQFFVVSSYEPVTGVGFDWLGPVISHCEAIAMQGEIVALYVQQDTDRKERQRLELEVIRFKVTLASCRQAIEDCIRHPMGVCPGSADEAWEWINRALGEDVAMDLAGAERRRVEVRESRS